MKKYLCLLFALSGCSVFDCAESTPYMATPRAVNQNCLATVQSLVPIVMTLMDRHDEYVVADIQMAPAEKNRALNESLLVRQAFCMRCVELYPIYETLIRCLDRLDNYAEYEVSDASRQMTLRMSHEVRSTVNRLLGSSIYVVPGRRSVISTYSDPCGASRSGTQSVEQFSSDPCGAGAMGFDARSLPPPPPPPSTARQLPADVDPNRPAQLKDNN